MVQTTPHHCPRCNTPFAEDRRICARCGFDQDASLSGLNAPQEPYPARPAAQSPQFKQISQHPLPLASLQVSQHPLLPVSQLVSQSPLLPVSQLVSQSPLLPASQLVSQSPLLPFLRQISQHPGLVQQQQTSEHAEERQADEIPTQAQPAVKPTSSPQSSQHPETMQPDEIPTQTQPAVKPASSPQWEKQQQTSEHAEERQVDEIPTQAQPAINPPSVPPSEQQQPLLHPETMQPERLPSSPQGDQPQPSLHSETMQPTEQPASPPKERSKKPVLIALLLLVLIVLGGGGYVGYIYFAHRLPTQTPITTTTLHSTAISYAGVAVTILSVQRSQIFLDDPNVASNSSDQTATAMVRINLHVRNTTTTSVNMLYDKITRLVLPGGKIVNPIYVKAILAIVPGMTLPAQIDFVVPASSRTDQLVLRLGASNEAQLDIPITANADMSMYGPKTEQMSGEVVYQGLNWSLVNATTQLSIDGQQAGSGMHFVTVTLKVDDTLQQPVISGSSFDYLRLNAGNVTASPLDSTLPVMFAKGETGKIGTVTFMVPQEATSLTLLFQQTGGFDAQTLTFQL